MSTFSLFLFWCQMSSARFLTPTVLSMWRLPGIRGGRSRGSSSPSMGWGSPSTSRCIQSTENVLYNNTSVSLTVFCRGRASVSRTLVAFSWCVSLHLMWLDHFTWVTPSPTPFRILWPDGNYLTINSKSYSQWDFCCTMGFLPIHCNLCQSVIEPILVYVSEVWGPLIKQESWVL